MAKTSQWGLRPTHQTVFRRTINLGTDKKPEKVQLVFNPDQPYDLTEQEVAGLKDDIENGIIVPWANGDRRVRPVENPTVADTSKLDSLQCAVDELKAQNDELNKQLADVKVPKKTAELQAEIKALKAQNDELTTANAELTAQLEDATAPDASDDEDETIDPTAPLGDE